MKLKKATALTFISVATFSLASPTFAQDAPSELATTAIAECTTTAEAKGYTVDPNGATVKSYEAATEKVTVALDLTKSADGTDARLTCPYSATAGAMLDEVSDTAAADTTLDDGSVSPWWWLLPILGIPLLYFLAKGKERTAPTGVVYDTADSDRSRRAVDRAEAIVRPNGEYLDIYNGPGTTYKVTGTLRNGQRIILSGRHENEWVELEGGGWIPRQYIEATYRQV